MEERNLRKTRVGVVVSDKMDKTIVVAVRDNVRHPLYNKIVKKTYKLKAHDEKNDAKIGDTVRVMETRPLFVVNGIYVGFSWNRRCCEQTEKNKLNSLIWAIS